MKGLYEEKSPIAFGIAGTMLLFVVVPLLPMSLMGLVLIVPGVLGLIGLWGLVNAWYGLDAPHFAQEANERILFRLCCGLGRRPSEVGFSTAGRSRPWNGSLSVPPRFIPLWQSSF